MEDLLKKLLDLGCRQVLLTGAEVRPGEVGVLGLDQTGRSFSYGLPRLPQSYHGTGDLFASACVGGLMNGLTLGTGGPDCRPVRLRLYFRHRRQPGCQLVWRRV